MIGREVGSYRILEKIGQGGMGIVYRGIHTQLEQEVAIKVLTPEYARDPSMQQRFIAEAKLQAKLSHPHVVNIFNYLQDADEVFLVMEYINGPTLERRLTTTSQLAEPEAVAICRDVLEALGFMHSRGIIHRDIKPSNIMFTETGLVKVTDFGIAKVAEERGQTKTGMHLGTLGYMAPEQIQGKPASAVSDLYTLGVTLYQMVTGRLPFQGDSEYTMMRAHIEEVPEPPWEINPHVSQDLGRVILKALEKKPEHRYQSAREFADALTGLTRPPYVRDASAQMPVPPELPKKAAFQLETWQYMTLFAAVGIILVAICYAVFFDGGPVPIYLSSGVVSPLTNGPTLRTGAEASPSPATPTPPPVVQTPVAPSYPALEDNVEDAPRVGKASPGEAIHLHEVTSMPPAGEGGDVRIPQGSPPGGETAQAPPADSADDARPSPPELVEQGFENKQDSNDTPPQEPKGTRQRRRSRQSAKLLPQKECPMSSTGWYIRK